jgi:hypothetical protein
MKEDNIQHTAVEGQLRKEEKKKCKEMSCSTQDKHYEFCLLLLTVYAYTQACDDANKVFLLNTIESGSLLFVQYSYKYTNNNMYPTFI